MPSDDIPDSTSNSRGHNNNTPSATNNNNQTPGSNGSNSNGSSVVNSTNQALLTPNSTIELGTPTGGNAISADSSVASSVSMDEDEEASPIKVKKKDENVSVDLL